MKAIRTLEFTVVIFDPSYWSEEHKEQLKKTNDLFDDFVYGQLRHHMIKAGREFVNNNLDLFEGTVI